MFRVISYSELENDINNCIFVDVRSEDEYKEATIPGSINIPLLVNEERVEVGTLYKKEGVQVAKEIGIEYVSKRLPQIFKEIEKIYSENKGKKIVLFCARGGMRSGSIYSLMNALGVHMYKLQGGYKGYRQHLNEELKKQCEDIKFITIYGNTGIGKTEILEKLKERGYDILDLEGAANHRGSLLGGVGLGSCHSQKMFESLVYEELRKRKTNLIFTEGESKRIGRIVMGDFLWNKIVESENVYITADLDFRAKRLVKEYTECENSEEDILDSLEKLKKYMNEERVENYKTLIKEHNFCDVAKDLMIKYYDPMYMGASKKREFLDKIHIESIDEAVLKLIDIYGKISDGENIETINGSEFLEDIN